jgi:hypothetical protein
MRVRCSQVVEVGDELAVELAARFRGEARFGFAVLDRFDRRSEIRFGL